MRHIDAIPKRSVLLVAIITGLVAAGLFLAFEVTSLRRWLDDDIEAYRAALLQAKRAHIHELVDLVIQTVELERASARAQLGAEAQPELVEARAKERIHAWLRGLRTADNGYFWINEILDYDGGDGYARRFVHPNLPETEGLPLSTNTRDAAGRLPYLAELEGVKKDGELFFIYDFKKPGTGDVALKMSYARLYKEYDWVIATGVYLDDVEAQASSYEATLRAANKQQMFLLVGFSVALLGAALAIVVAAGRQVYAAVTRQAERDQLTGLYNRTVGQNRLDQELARSRRRGGSLSLLLCDLDHFKRINDTYGHPAGDAILRMVAEVFTTGLRIEDSAFRWGGEEFLLILGAVGI